MIFFENDYSNGAHPEVLRALVNTNGTHQNAYGSDEYSIRAREKIKAACGCQGAEIYFLTGGTQTNAVVAASMLPPGDGAVCADTGHIASHEAGAIEYTGHKVLTLPSHNGKIDPEELSAYLSAARADVNAEHMVSPGMVYISYPTEYGTLYSKSELTALHDICDKFDIPLYLDGARLGYGLASPECDLTLSDIARLCDVFYIGGTKVGALCGEAVVFTKNNAPRRFFSQVKQHGALNAKGRLCGAQFDALFTNGLYAEIGARGISAAMKLKELFKSAGCRFFLDSPTNQQFIILDNETLRRLSRHVAFSIWEKYDPDRTVVRFVTSWSTTDDDIAALARLIKNIKE